MKKLVVLSLILLIAAFSNIDAQKKKVTFKADMRIEISKGTFNPATDVVTVPGGMNNWLNEPPANSTKVLTDTDNDKIYELMYELDPGTYDYKFNIGLGWDGKDEPGDNSKVTVGTEDVTITRFMYNKTPYTNVATNVTFSVDMTLPINQGFNPATGKVYVAGSFTDWQNSALEMTDTDGDKKFTATVSLTSGSVLEYKFIHSPNTAGNGSWESPANTPSMKDVLGGGNRIYGVVDGTNTIERFWNNSDPNVQIASGNMAFTVDMSVLEEIGKFNPVVDKLEIRGGFNGWSNTDAAKSNMNQNPLFPEEWFLSIPFVNQEVGKDQTYKYYAIIANPGIWTDTWERPLSTGGGDRSTPFEGKANQEVKKMYYDDVYPAFVIPNGSFVQIKFRVDMKDAYDANKVAVPMETSDKLYWLPRQPLFKTIMGWTGEEDAVEQFELTDPDGDKIYEGTLTVNGPAFNAFQYRYGYKKASDQSWQREPTALGTTKSGRVRFIPQTKARTFTQPYTAPLDSWLVDADKSSQFETWPAGLPTSVRDLDLGLPTEYTLQQNYPNPFNPSTLIRFTIPQENKVSLKVFNVLGQEVASLVNENMKAGTYEYMFSGAKLSSGVYFYTINAGSFNSTKKMLLIK
ncbi:MAG: T9SS type A sorting domain-containing protein [Melioribacteraceae bacterium]|nr:T9SS type A sorting domain-containing protein [Melioribacteraceae bacterium]